MKKVVSIILVAVLLISLSSISVFASAGRVRGNGNCQRHITQSQELRQQSVCPRFEVCAVEDCNIRGVHEHDGEYYRCSYYPCSYCYTGFYYGLSRGCGVCRNERGMARGTRLRNGSSQFR